MKRLFAPFLFAALLAGCQSPSQEFLIDNPTDAALTLSIDGTDYQVPAHNAVPVTLPPGEHTLRSARLGEVRVIVYADRKAGLINPTLSDYVLANEIYVTGEDKLKNFGAINARIDLDGVTFEGPFSKTHDLFIDKTWTFGVREPFPEVQTVAHVSDNGGRISTKIFTPTDFIAYVEQGMGEPGAYQRENPKGFQQATHTLETAPQQLPALAPAFEQHAGPLRSLYARHLQATSADTQKALDKEAFNAQMAFTSATAQAMGQNMGKAMEGYNQFVSDFGQLRGRSALIVAISKP